MSTDPQNLQPGDAVGTPPAAGTSSAPIAGSAASPGATAGPPGTLPADDVASLFDAATAAVTETSTGLGSNLVDLAPGTAPRISRSHTDIEKGALAIASLLVQNPTIAAAISPTNLVARVSQMQAGDRLVGALKTLTTQVENTVQVIANGVWKDARTGYHNAGRAAEESGVVAAAIEPMVAMFAREPRETTAVVNAATDTVKATKATGRATTANTRAANARQHAKDIAPDAMNALQDGTGDATITQPAPSAPATSTTAASAPAPGATPGTPGSTTIR